MLNTQTFRLVFGDLLNNSSFADGYNCIWSNSSSLIEESPLSTTEATEVDVDKYEYNGALLYIVVIFALYSMSVIALIRLQIRKTDLHYYEDGDDPQDTAHNLLKRIRTEDTKRKALVDLSDKAFRQRLWEIYLGKPNEYKINKTENKRLQQIDKKLKQYYSSEKEHSKTIDLAQLDAGKSSNRRPESLSLVKHFNQVPSQHQHMHHQQPGLINQEEPNQFYTRDQAWFYSGSPESSITPAQSRTLRPSQSFINNNFNSALNHSASQSRFKVEKIKENPKSTDDMV